MRDIITSHSRAGRRGTRRRHAFSARPAHYAANDPPKIGIVGKVKIPWFDNVEKGVLQAGQDLGVDASIINPTTDDPAEQVRAIEDLIAKKVDVIGVVPNDGKALEPVLKRAQDAGIKVMMNELPGQKNADWDIELIQDKAFGEAHLEAFAEAIGGEGKYVVFVGGLTVALHNLWADYAVALQKEKYPNMQQIGDRFGVSNSVDDSYKTAIDQMQANPDLKGFLIFGANGPIGAGNAVSDRDKIGKVIVVGPFIPSQGQQADEVRSHHPRLSVEPDRLRLCDGRARQDAGEGRRDQGRHRPAGHGTVPSRRVDAGDPRQQANRSEPASRSTNGRRSSELQRTEVGLPAWVTERRVASRLRHGWDATRREQAFTSAVSESELEMTFPLATSAARSAPLLPLANISKRFGGTAGARRHRLVGRARRGALPGRRERFGQVDADQDPVRRPCARPGRRDHHATACAHSGLTPAPGTATRHPGHLPGPVALPEPDGRGEHRHRPGAVGAVEAAAAKADARRPRRRRLPDSTPTFRSMRRVGRLPVAQRQIVAICRGLAANARILFMDEPTASLTRHEVDLLLATVRRLQVARRRRRLRQPPARRGRSRSPSG